MLPRNLIQVNPPRSRQVQSMPTRLEGQVVVTNEVIEANQKALTIAAPAEARAKVRAFHDRQRKIEEEFFRQAQVCPIGIQSNLSDRLSKIEPQEFKTLLRDNFFDPSVMKAGMCVTESIAYAPPSNAGGMAANFRIKRWIHDLKRIGAESVEGFALRGDFDKSNDTFIVKSPRDPQNPMLLHEYFVGVYGLNQLRAVVPNFAYVLGGFRCSIPIIDDETNKVSAWCNNTKYPIDYVVYENVAPAQTMKDWVSKNCNFKNWLVYYLQILYATQVGVEMADYTHYDLHDENVLRREVPGSTKSFAIPYRTERGTEYLISDAVATIIDYGLAHIKYQGRNFGVYDRLPWAVLPTRSFPLHDAYKFLLMSMRTMFQAKKMDCFWKAAEILKFFNDREDAINIVKIQAKTYYFLPYNQKTMNLKIYDLTKFIRQKFDTSSILVPSKPTGRVLGCQGTDICLGSDTVINKIGMSGPPMATTIFDFYDLMTRFQNEGKTQEMDRIKQGFNYRLASVETKKKYNQSLAKLTSLSENLVVFSVNGQPPDTILSPTFLKSYRNYISKVASIYDTLQELDILQTVLVFAAKIYGDPVAIREVISSYNLMRREFDQVWKQILISIQNDNNYLQTMLRNPVYLARINQATASNPALSWWWNFYPDIVSVIQ